MAETTRSNWWAVAAIYKIIHPGIAHRYLSKRLGEKRVFLVNAANEEEAVRAGQELAKGDKPQYRNPFGHLVCWRFVKLKEVVHLNTEEIGYG